MSENTTTIARMHYYSCIVKVINNSLQRNTGINYLFNKHTRVHDNCNLQYRITTLLNGM